MKQVYAPRKIRVRNYPHYAQTMGKFDFNLQATAIAAGATIAALFIFAKIKKGKR